MLYVNQPLSEEWKERLDGNAQALWGMPAADYARGIAEIPFDTFEDRVEVHWRLCADMLDVVRRFWSVDGFWGDWMEEPLSDWLTYAWDGETAYEVMQKAPRYILAWRARADQGLTLQIDSAGIKF